MGIERALPRLQLFLGKSVPAASFLHGDGAVVQGCEDGGLAASHPSLGVCRRQISHQPRLPAGLAFHGPRVHLLAPTPLLPQRRIPLPPRPGRIGEPFLWLKMVNFYCPYCGGTGRLFAASRADQRSRVSTCEPRTRCNDRGRANQERRGKWARDSGF